MVDTDDTRHMTDNGMGAHRTLISDMYSGAGRHLVNADLCLN